MAAVAVTIAVAAAVTVAVSANNLVLGFPDRYYLYQVWYFNNFLFTVSLLQLN